MNDKDYYHVDCVTGALVLIDILFDMHAINKATYEDIKRSVYEGRKGYENG